MPKLAALATVVLTVLAMAVAMARQDLLVELHYGGDWNDVTDTVMTRDQIEIRYGSGDESPPAPATLNLTLLNTDGRYSLRNPESPLYGLIGRNTPVRVSVDGEERFHGEVMSWPNDTVAGEAVTVSAIESSDVTRRLGQGDEPERDATRRLVELASDPVAYWPLSDDQDSRTGASLLPGADVMRYNRFDNEFVSPVRPRFGVDQLHPWLPTGMTTVGARDAELSGGEMIGAVQSVAPSSEAAMDVMFRAPPGAEDGDKPTVMQFSFSTGERRWFFLLNQDLTGIDVAVYDQNNNFQDGDPQITIGTLFDDEAHHLRLHVADAGGTNANYTMYVDGVAVGSGTLNAQADPPVHRPTDAILTWITDAPQSLVAPVIMGQVVLWGNPEPIFDAYSASNGWTAELAGRRVERLAGETGVPFTADGDMDDTQRMGPQQPASVFDLMRSAAATDMGDLLGDRTSDGIRYRPGREQYNRAPSLVLDFDGGDVGVPLAPLEDDQQTRNDVTVARDGGALARRVRTDGPLAVHAPPDGVGRYSDSVTLSLDDDVRLADQAGWRLHLGTVDEPRYADVAVDLVGSPGLAVTAPLVDVGDRIDLINLPARLTPDTASLIVTGYTEIIGSHTRRIRFHGRPASGFAVPVLDDETARLDSRHSTSGAVSSSDTVLPVSVPPGRASWTDDDAPFDLRVGGERMTVTAVSVPASSDHRPAADQDATASTSHVAPSVTPVRPDAVLICAWCSWAFPGTYTVPGSMTEHAQTSGTFSTLADATEVVPGMATGTRTAMFDVSDAWAAVSDSYDATYGVQVVEQLAEFEPGVDITMQTSPGTVAGWFLIAIHAWDEDPAGAMAAPGPGWALLNSTGALSGVPRIRVWAKVAESGPNGVTLSGGATDNHGRLYVVRGQFDQQFTVTRSVNGVVKPHPAGERVRLFSPSWIGL